MEAMHAEALVNAENPWPGLAAFPESAYSFFHGRDPAIAELQRLVSGSVAAVLFAQSGLGKTSLIQAGLFPRLRAEQGLPVYVRLDYAAHALPLTEQIAVAIEAACREHRVDVTARRPGESLWSWLHRRDTDFWADGIDLVTPILVLDQFEELFTLGRQGIGAEERRACFLDELAALVENRPPQFIREQVLADPALSRDYDFSRARFRLLFSLREDFLPDFEGLLAQMPSLRLHRMRLLAMNGPEALAVVRGGGEIVAPGVAERLVRFVAADTRGRSLEELAVEPSLLSLVCRELNQRRLDQKRPVIDTGLLSGAREEILGEFYTRSLSDQPPALVELIEERLLSESGYRNDMVLEDALALPGVTQEAIHRLIERRLLRLEERSGSVRVELTHDVLTSVARDCRQRRRQMVAQAEAARQLAQNRRRLRLMGGAAFAMLLLVVVMATLNWKMYEAQQPGTKGQ